MADFNVYTDSRFYPYSGMDKVERALLDRKPINAHINKIVVPGKYGHPLSFLRLTRALLGKPSKNSVFWSAGFVPPLYSALPAVVTVHDLIHIHHYDRKHRDYYNLVFRPLYKRCAAIISVSEHAKNEFVEWSGVPAEKVHVIYNGLDPAYANNTRSLDLGYKYIVYAGNHRPHKNIETLIRAYAQSRLMERSIHLAMTGVEDEYLKPIIAETKTRAFIHFLGHVPEADMPALYRGSEALSYISLYEGFGLPILEAMASEVPVVTSNISSMPEVAGDAAIIVDPLAVTEVAHALTELVDNTPLRSALIQKGLKRIEAFSWDTSAGALWQLLERVAVSGRS